MPLEFPTAVYRLFDHENQLLYVGVTDSPARRMAQHARDRAWWPDVARQELDWHDQRSDALKAESFAILNEHPIHNVTGTGPKPHRADWSDVPDLWDGDGDVIEQVHRVIAADCKDHALIRLMCALLLEGYREAPAGRELAEIAAKVNVCKSTAYHLARILRERRNGWGAAAS